jgi:hypothetical protein
VRGTQQLFEALRRHRRSLRQEREDSPAAVVDHHDSQVDSARGEAEQTVVVVQEGDVADQQARRPTRADCRAERTRHDAVDTVRPAVRQHDEVVGGSRVPLEVAHRHRRRHEQLRTDRKRRSDRARDARLAEHRLVVEQRGDHRACGELGVIPDLQPRGVARFHETGEVVASRVGVDDEMQRRAPVGIRQTRRVGQGDRLGCAVAQETIDHLRCRQCPEPQHHLRLQPSRKVGIAQECVGVPHGARMFRSRARQRVTDDRPCEPGCQRVHLRGRGAAGARHDDPASARQATQQARQLLGRQSPRDRPLP